MKRLLLAVIILGGLSLSASAQAGKNKQPGQAKDTRSARTAPQKTASTNEIVVVNGKKVKPTTEGNSANKPKEKDNFSYQAAEVVGDANKAPQASQAQSQSLPKKKGGKIKADL